MAQSQAITFARKAALWLLSFAFFLLLSSAIIGFAFMQKFFDAPTYFKSMEKHGVYGKVQDYFSSSLANSFPSEMRGDAKVLVGQAVTAAYVRGQVDGMVQSGLDYLASKKNSLDLEMDLSPLRTAAEKSQNVAFQMAAPSLPSSMDFGKAIEGSPQFTQLQNLRAQIAEADRFNSIALVVSIVILIPYFLLQPGYQTGLHECGKLIFGCGTSTLLGGLAMAFLAPQFLPQFISGLQPDPQAAGSATLIGQIIGDALYEVGIATVLYSLPLVLGGLALRTAFSPENPGQLQDFAKIASDSSLQHQQQGQMPGQPPMPQ